MKDRSNVTTALIGGLLAVASMTTAFSAARDATAGRPAVTGTGRLIGAGIAVAPALTEAERDAESAESSRPVRVDGWDITVTRNRQVERWIEYLAGRNKDNTEVWLERQGKYGPMIRAELSSRGMPEDLLYLAIIESGLSPKAYSRAKASGMWQFIAETGKRYGLEVSSEVDERRDPIKATSAALDYLQELYDRFGSWYLAAAAYNTGENRVDRLLREHAGGARGSDALYWAISPYLPQETRDYVPLMLAAGHIAKDAERYGFDLDYQPELAFDVVWVPGTTRISTIARASGVDSAAVAELNPHLTKARTPSNRGWAVRVPAGARERFETGFPALYRSERLAVAEKPKAEPRRSTRYHSVRRGENLSVIAARYDLSVKKLRSLNGLRTSTIRPGQKLRVSS